MKIKYLIAALMSLCVATLTAQPPSATSVTEAFAKNLSGWVNSGDFNCLINLGDLYSKSKPSFIIADDLAHVLANRNGLSRNSSYTWDSFEAWMEKEIGRGLRLSVSDIRSVPRYQISAYGGNASDFDYAACRINTSGTLSHSESALFVIKDGKVCKIGPYEETVDTQTGQRKVRIDLSGLSDMDYTTTLGAMYSYGKHFPVGVSVDGAYGKFSLGIDIGFSSDKRSYKTMKIKSFTNLSNYKAEKGVYTPKMYLCASPGIYLNYFSVNCGVGCMIFTGTKTVAQMSGSYDGDRFSFNGGQIGETSSGMYKFMLRPSVKGYIPCSDSFFISLGIGYDIIFGYKRLNGLNYGLGIRLVLD